MAPILSAEFNKNVLFQTVFLVILPTGKSWKITPVTKYLKKMLTWNLLIVSFTFQALQSTPCDGENW